MSTLPLVLLVIAYMVMTGELEIKVTLVIKEEESKEDQHAE